MPPREKKHPSLGTTVTAYSSSSFLPSKGGQCLGEPLDMESSGILSYCSFIPAGVPESSAYSCDELITLRKVSQALVPRV